MHRVIETHGVQKMPHARTPYTGEHTVPAVIIAFFKRAVPHNPEAILIRRKIDIERERVYYYDNNIIYNLN